MNRVSKKALLLSLMAITQSAFIIAEPIIDVVIPCHEKDARTLDLVVDGIRHNGQGVRRVIVVSAKRLTQKAEWFDEALFPFSKNAIAVAIFKGDEDQAKKYISDSRNRLGWIYQQLLKLYAPFVIPNISSNVLILDSDTIFLNKVSFIDAQGNALFNVGHQYHKPYFEHMNLLIPGLKRVFRDYSGICHHMLFQKYILEDLFHDIEICHGKDAWEVLAETIDPKDLFHSALSEYEIYFNYVFSRTYKAKIRTLNWREFGFNHNAIAECKKHGCDYVSCHSYMRGE